MNTATQRRMAASLLSVGANRIWIDPVQVEKIAGALTKQDVRNLIESGAIRKKQIRGQSRGRARVILTQKKKGRRKGHGSRKGASGARLGVNPWVVRVRALRRHLNELSEQLKLSGEEKRSIYLMIKGGFFRNKKHLEITIHKRQES